jgi:hypothetical protein
MEESLCRKSDSHLVGQGILRLIQTLVWSQNHQISPHHEPILYIPLLRTPFILKAYFNIVLPYLSRSLMHFVHLRISTENFYESFIPSIPATFHDQLISFGVTTD